MFAGLRKFFDERLAPTGEPDPEHRLRLAAAMVMLEVSRADFKISDAELATVALALQERFGLSRDDLDELLEVAKAESEESHSLHEFLRLINEQFSPEQKAGMVEDLWRVAYADGRLDKYEEYHVRRIADLLYVPHSLFMRGKHRAKESEGQG